MRGPLPPSALLIYFVAYALVAFVWRWVIVRRRTGINPLVIGSTTGAHMHIGRAFALVCAACATVVVCLAAFRDAPRWFGAYPPLQLQSLAWTGWVLLAGSMIWLIIAQAQMGASWRVGIDSQHRTELVERGLFSLSRNPIYLAARVGLFGFLLVFPSAATLALLVAGDILLQIQVRLEEQHIAAMHPESYAAYSSRVRRWI